MINGHAKLHKSHTFLAHLELKKKNNFFRDSQTPVIYSSCSLKGCGIPICTSNVAKIYTPHLKGGTEVNITMEN